MGHLLVHRQRTQFHHRDGVVQPDAGTGDQLGDGDRYGGSQSTRSARQVAIVGAFDDHLSLASRQGMFGDQVLLMKDPDAARSQRLAYQNTLARMGMRHGITVAPIAHHAVPGHLTVADIAGVVMRLAVQRREPFARQSLDRHLARGSMDTTVRLFAPGQRLAVQLRQRVEAQPWPEARLYIADGGLDLTLGLWSIRMAGPRHEAVVAGEVQHLRMETWLAV